MAEVLASEMLGRDELQPGEPQGVDPSSRTARIGAVFSGGRSDPDGSADVEEEAEEGGGTRSSPRTTSPGGAERNPEEEEDRGAHWAERRASKAERRVARAVRAVQRRHQRGHDGGQADRVAEAHDRSLQGNRRASTNQGGGGPGQSRGSTEVSSEAKASSKDIGSARIARHSRDRAASPTGSPNGPTGGTTDHGYEDTDGSTCGTRSRTRSLHKSHSSGGKCSGDDEHAQRGSRDGGQHELGTRLRSESRVLSAELDTDL